MVTTTIVGMVQLAVLTRLLSRADFGLMAMIVTVVGFAQVYADMGFSGAIIYRQDATRDQLSTLYWMNLVASFVIFLAVAASSPLVAAFFHEPGLRRPMLWASLLFLVTPVGQQFQMLLQKELLFKRLGLIEITSSLLGLGVAVASGIAHQGVYALIWAQLASATAKATLACLVRLAPLEAASPCPLRRPQGIRRLWRLPDGRAQHLLLGGEHRLPAHRTLSGRRPSGSVHDRLPACGRAGEQAQPGAHARRLSGVLQAPARRRRSAPRLL